MADVFEPRNTAGEVYIPCNIDTLEVLEWSRLPLGEGEATEVHARVLLEGAKDVAMVMRFHGPGTLDKFISALAAHRYSVWPREEG